MTIVGAQHTAVRYHHFTEVSFEFRRTVAPEDVRSVGENASSPVGTIHGLARMNFALHDASSTSGVDDVKHIGVGLKSPDTTGKSHCETGIDRNLM